MPDHLEHRANGQAVSGDLLILLPYEHHFATDQTHDTDVRPNVFRPLNIILKFPGPHNVHQIAQVFETEIWGWKASTNQGHHHEQSLPAR